MFNRLIVARKKKLGKKYLDRFIQYCKYILKLACSKFFISIGNGILSLQLTVILSQRYKGLLSHAVRKSVMGASAISSQKFIRILLVENDASVVEMIVEALESQYLHIEVAHSLSIARETIMNYENEWHCWIIDIDLGEKKNGLWLMKEFSYYPFIVIMSGLKDMRLSFEAARLGALDVFDKKPSNSLSDFIDSIYRIAVLGYLLKGKRSDYLHIFLTLKNHIFYTAPEWARYACISLRYLERLCKIHFDLSPRYILPLYYHLFRLLYLSELNGDFLSFKQRYSHADRKFIDNCSKFVIEHKELLQPFLF